MTRQTIQAVPIGAATDFKGGKVKVTIERLITAAKASGGMVGQDAITALMAEAWEEGAVAGWSQSGEGYNAEYPDEGTGKWSVDLTKNPYK